MKYKVGNATKISPDPDDDTLEQQRFSILPCGELRKTGWDVMSWVGVAPVRSAAVWSHFGSLNRTGYFSENDGGISCTPVAGSNLLQFRCNYNGILSEHELSKG